MGIDWTLAGSVIFTGITVVFVVLLVLWAVVALMGVILRRIAPLPTGSSAPLAATTGDISGEEIAVISAAMTVVQGDKNFAITQIKRLDKTN